MKTFFYFMVSMILVVSSLTLSGCDDDDDDNGDEIIELGFDLIVANGLAGTLSLINTTAQEVENDAIVVGTSPQTVTTTSDGLMAYVVNSGDNTVQVIDLQSREITTTIDMGQSANPWDMVLDEDNQRGYVSNTVANQIAEIDLSTHTITRTIDVRKSPQDLLLHGNYLYSANSGFDFNTYAYDPASVAVIDLASFTVIDSIAVELNAQYLIVDGDNELHVICTGNYGFGDPPVDGKITVIDLSTRTVTTTIDVGGSPGFGAMDDDGTIFLIGYGLGIIGYDSQTNQMIYDVENPLINISGGAFVIDGIGDYIYANDGANNQVQVIDVNTGESIYQYLVGDGPQAITWR